MDLSQPVSSIDTVAGHAQRYGIPPSTLRDAINSGKIAVGRITESSSGIKFFQLERADLDRLHTALVAAQCAKLKNLFPSKSSSELTREISNVLKNIATEQITAEERASNH